MGFVKKALKSGALGIIPQALANKEGMGPAQALFGALADHLQSEKKQHDQHIHIHKHKK